jgi:hypothetical protein
VNKTLLSVLNDSERLLVAETERAALEPLDEDGVVELHDRIRRARNKYVGQYRRGASTRVAAKGARGAARPANETASLKAEAFEESLSRVSRRLAVLSRQSASALRATRLAEAGGPSTAPANRRPARTGTRAVRGGQTAAPKGDRSLRSPASEKRRAGTRAVGAKRQAKRDSK